MKKVEIKWLDSNVIVSGWEQRRRLSALKPTEVSSIGYLLEETREYKTLVGSFSTHNVLGRITIPTVAIKAMREIA
jgi:hypothetical protein